MLRPLAGAAVIVISSLTLAGQPPVIAQASLTASTTAATKSINRFNEDATHSPQLEHQLVRQPTAAPTEAPLAAMSAASAASQSVTASSLLGIDVASFQHSGGAAIDWSTVAATYKFAFIKASEGSYYVNPYYAGDKAGAEAQHMFVAPYVFAIPNYSGGALQADYALDKIAYAPDGQTLPMIIDLEYDPYKTEDGTNDCYGLSPAQMVSWISAFVTEVHRRTGQLPIIYTVAGWWNNCTADSAAFTADPLWIADFNTTSENQPSPTAVPNEPGAWNGAWTYWQWTSLGQVSGITGNTDISSLSSTALQLAAPANQSNQAGSTPANLTPNALNGTSTAATFSAASLPNGLSMPDSTSGVISGQLTGGAATFHPSITATAGSLSATTNFTWNVHGTVSLASLPGRTGSIGTPVRVQVTAADSLPGCTLTFTATGLPNGLRMSSCGLISGWPQASGQRTVNVTVTDSTNTTLAHGSFVWKIARASGAGPAGHITLRRDGKCLAALSGTDIAIETCSSSTSQHWTIAADGTLRINGGCLTARAVTTSSPAALYLGTCKGGQRWQLNSNAVLKNLTDGRCLADTGTKNGARAVAATCVATPNNTGSASTPSTSQQWTLPAGPLTSGIAGFCASDWHRASLPLGPVSLRTCNGTAPQAWTIEPDGTIRASGKCLDLYLGHTTAGTAVRLVTCKSASGLPVPSQVWQLTGGPIGVQLLSPLAGLCMSDPGDRAVAGTRLVLGGCVAGDPGIAWRVS